MAKIDNVTRVVVVDHQTTDAYGNVAGRVIDKSNVKVELQYQDDGRTLKLFISKRLPHDGNI